MIPRRSPMTRTLTGAAVAAIVASTAVALGASAASAASAASGDRTGSTTCTLDHGVKHVIEITFDNVHLFRDNPNVPSDLELMPHLKQFLENNCSLLSNVHTRRW
jgi:hypothetical protein